MIGSGTDADPLKSAIRQADLELQVLLSAMRSGQSPQVTPELANLAAQAAKEQEAADQSDVDSWAERLADDLSHGTD